MKAPVEYTLQSSPLNIIRVSDTSIYNLGFTLFVQPTQIPIFILSSFLMAEDSLENTRGTKLAEINLFRFIERISTKTTLVQKLWHYGAAKYF